ncbi:hypothetical protein [Desulfosporosinus nitroreducens]|uniref:LPXTG cell wall anchor domain-containing protein n=2 Tax=Desulfosporosinus nitroreducens TaxID=2018668 RepID=A0ABT8QLF4_9FIRM|nr:hypothetical protein [Desulfosporosinus nitroreducens]MDO0822173.1 hypothetical protein [Desulfosporosinus nitroreducens]
MEVKIDNFLENIFGNPMFLYVNLFLGLALVAAGAILLKKNQSKGKKTVGIICTGIGIVAGLFNLVRILL